VRLYFRLSLMREKDVLRQYSNRYYGLILEAHTLELYSNSTLNFLKDLENPFIIDPVTYKFALPSIIELADKRWFEKLVDAYSLPIDATSPLVIPERLTGKVLKRHVEGTVNYQRGISSKLQTVMQSVAGLLLWMSEGNTLFKRSNFSPEYIVSPYFILENINHTSYREWLDINRNSIELTREILNGDEKLLAVIALGEETFLSDEALDEIIQEYKDLKADAYALWVSNFDEVTQAPDILRRFINFAERLRRNAPLLNLYGGYFSLLLSNRDKNLLEGVAQGITVAEHRDPFSYGGFAVPRYYLPKLHLFISHEDAGLLSSVPELKCNCPLCNRLQGVSDFSNMSVTDTMIHFVHNRTAEAREVEEKSLNELLNSLDEIYDLIENLQRRSRLIKLVYYGHLRSWAEVLREN